MAREELGGRMHHDVYTWLTDFGIPKWGDLGRSWENCANKFHQNVKFDIALPEKSNKFEKSRGQHRQTGKRRKQTEKKTPLGPWPRVSGLQITGGIMVLSTETRMPYLSGWATVAVETLWNCATGQPWLVSNGANASHVCDPHARIRPDPARDASRWFATSTNDFVVGSQVLADCGGPRNFWLQLGRPTPKSPWHAKWNESERASALKPPFTAQTSCWLPETLLVQLKDT